MPDTVLYAVLGAVIGALAAALLLVRRHTALHARAARLDAEREAAERAAADQRAQAAHTETQLREAFAALSREALRDNRSEFMHTAGQLLQPVRETLDKVQTQLVDFDKAREGSFQAVAAQIGSLARAQEELRRAADGLTHSLRSPNARGKWGEIQLRRIVELAGMVEQCDFFEQLTATTADGARQTPDLVVRLPGNGHIVVDAKVPIDGYLALADCRTEGERTGRLAVHARQVRDHIRALGAKEYWRQFQPAPEFVVMFLPLEPLLAAAFEHDGTLFDQAASLRVIPATPMTLLALLKAVAYGWQQQRLATNAEEIQLLGRDLYDRLATMADHLEGVGRSIKLAADSYDRFVGSLETKVLPGARRFKELGVSSSKDLEVPEPLRLSVRRLSNSVIE
jgi:DNA recombination protein RmuC